MPGGSGNNATLAAAALHDSDDVGNDDEDMGEGETAIPLPRATIQPKGESWL
jgi:hypothetical protein